jgi:hypothetical protein
LRRLLIWELEKIFSSLKGAELYHSYLVRKGSWLSHLFLLTTYLHDLKGKGQRKRGEHQKHFGDVDGVELMFNKHISDDNLTPFLSRKSISEFITLSGDWHYPTDFT